MTQDRVESDGAFDRLSRASEAESKLSLSKQGSYLGEHEGEGEGEHSEEDAPVVEQLLPGTNIVTHCIYKNDPQRFIQCFEDDQDPYKDGVLELLNDRFDDGKSPLDICACLGRNQLTQELLQRGSDATIITKKGYTPLHYAAVWGRLPVVKMLFEAGADLQQRNSHGERARDAAMRYDQNECVDFLDWAEAKTLLAEHIRQTLETMTDVDKALAGRITKEEKTITLNICKEKQEWLDNTVDPTTQDFIAQRTHFSEVVTSIVQKLTEPLFSNNDWDSYYTN